MGLRDSLKSFPIIVGPMVPTPFKFELPFMSFWSDKQAVKSKNRSNNDKEKRKELK